MRCLALVSQKGGAGKTTLALHLAVAARLAGLAVAVVDLDPQSSAWKWSERRGDHPKVVTATAEQLESVKSTAENGGIDLLIVDSAPHADRPALVACKAADFVMIPCRASIVDIDAIGATFDLTSITQRRAAVVFNACKTTTGADLAGARGGMRTRGIPLFPGAIYDRVGYSRALISGKVAQEIETDGRAAQEIGELFAWTLGELGLELPRVAA